MLLRRVTVPVLARIRYIGVCRVFAHTSKICAAAAALVEGEVGALLLVTLVMVHWLSPGKGRGILDRVEIELLKGAQSHGELKVRALRRKISKDRSQLEGRLGLLTAQKGRIEEAFCAPVKGAIVRKRPRFPHPLEPPTPLNPPGHKSPHELKHPAA